MPTGHGGGPNSARLAHLQAIAAVTPQNERLTFEGRQYRLLPGADWTERKWGAEYQIVPPADARELVNRMATVARGPESQRNAMRELGPLLHHGTSKPIEERLLLLRWVPRPSHSSAPSAAPITPSQLRKMMLQEDHWIEIELVDEAGDPVADVAYVITAPDGTEHAGRTDGEGTARVSEIASGQCKIRFPELDKDAWANG